MASIVENMQDVHSNIVAAARNAGRQENEITLLAVSKTFDAQAVIEAVGGGQRDFGENYLQEALAKMTTVAGLLARPDATGALAGPAALATEGVANPGFNEAAGATASLCNTMPATTPVLTWHFIGPIQSNKTRPIAEHFDWVHSVERLKIAERLSSQRPAGMAPLNVCLQVNISGEASKSGATPEELPALALAVAALPGLRLRGLMAIPEAAGDEAAQRVPFRHLRELFEDLLRRGLALDCLSMGMSGDMGAAIAEGATMVRIGSAIFGRRAAH